MERRLAKVVTINEGTVHNFASNDGKAIMVQPMNESVKQLQYLGPNNLKENNSMAGAGTSSQTEKVMPKKHSRIEDIEEEQNTNRLEPMQVEEGLQTLRTEAAGSNLTKQQNPLFDVNVVLAGPENQACQKK
ncbi:hypothetical protein A2U01_0000978 [Trifolium medium]|uniref:Uncharacterized protein n=1 Tax=Trifolium medium TaxID=97028 RepID=A0A392LYY9_9FABA|nr:hypothetical protein [Trifolium medium]